MNDPILQCQLSWLPIPSAVWCVELTPGCCPVIRVPSGDHLPAAVWCVWGDELYTSCAAAYAVRCCNVSESNNCKSSRSISEWWRATTPQGNNSLIIQKQELPHVGKVEASRSNTAGVGRVAIKVWEVVFDWNKLNSVKTPADRENLLCYQSTDHHLIHTEWSCNHLTEQWSKVAGPGRSSTSNPHSLK